MSIWKTFASAAAIAAIFVAAPQARAAQPGVLVTGDNLPTNLDPHQIFDVPMMLYSLNAYDNLYRYQGNPPELKPWLAQSHTVSQDGKITLATIQFRGAGVLSPTSLYFTSKGRLLVAPGGYEFEVN